MDSQDKPARKPGRRTMSEEEQQARSAAPKAHRDEYGMSAEELTALEMREDRRLINLGIDPDLDPAAIYRILIDRDRAEKPHQD